MHTDPLVDDGPLLLQRCFRVGKLGDEAGIHGHIFVGCQLLGDTVRRQDGGLPQHLIHGGNGIPVVEGDAHRAHQDQGDDDGRHQAHCDLFANTPHLSAPLFLGGITAY